MTGTTAQKPSADGGTELPRPRRGSRWRWSRPHQALVAGGALAAVLSLGVATGAGAATTTPGNSGGAAHGRPPGGTARPTVSGKITALSGDDITVETNAKTTVTVVYSSSTTFKDRSGAGRGHDVQRIGPEGRRLHRRAGHQEQRQLRRPRRASRSAGRNRWARAGGRRRVERLARDPPAPAQHLVLAAVVGGGNAQLAAARLGPDHLGPERCVLHDVGLPHVGRSGWDRSSAASTTRTPQCSRPAPAPRRRRRVVQADEADVGVLVGQGAAPVQTGHHPRAPVLLGGVGQRHPTGEVLLRLHEGVPVVLVPGERRLGPRLLVDRLVPVEADIGSDEVGADVRRGARST